MRGEAVHGFRGVVVAVALAAALVAGCSDDDDGGGATTTGAAAGPSTTAAAGPSTTAGGAEDAFTVRALAAAGTWTGTWTNDTFGSTGPVSLELTVDEDAGTLDAVMDLGGNVFGAADPDAEMFSIPLASGTASGTSQVFGSYEVTVGVDGSVEVVATAPPVLPAGTFTMQGELVGDSFSGTYEVDFGDGRDLATGRFELLQQQT